MEPDFWHERWHTGKIGFHQEEVNPYLMQFWPRLQASPDQGVLVPLCGKSRDMLWLQAQAQAVIGVELSPLAVNDFFESNQWPAEHDKVIGFDRSRYGSMQILCGNFFDLKNTPESPVNNISLVYDRASLIALPPSMRQKYAQHMTQLLPSSAQILLLTLEYPPHQMDGPPFSVDKQEIQRLYAEFFDIEKLGTEEALEKNEKFKAQGVSEMFEASYLLTKK